MFGSRWVFRSLRVRAPWVWKGLLERTAETESPFANLQWKRIISNYLTSFPFDEGKKTEKEADFEEKDMLSQSKTEENVVVL